MRMMPWQMFTDHRGLCLIKERASDLWRQLKFTAHKSNAVELLLGGHALLLLEFFFNSRDSFADH